MPRQKNWLTKGGFAREDSDDELGYEDLPWQWVFDDKTNNRKNDEDEEKADTAATTIAVTADTTSNIPSKSLKRKSTAISSKDDTNMASSSSSSSRIKRIITGAQMGEFSIKVGDAILLKSPEAGKDWAGLICAFSETNEDGEKEMCAHIMWFCSREELESTTNIISTSTAKEGKTSTSTTARGRRRVLPEAMPNESYITADFNMNPLTAINGKATILGKDDFVRLYPGGKCPKGKAAAAKWSKTIMCRRGVKQRNLRFTEEFDWGDVYSGPGDLLGLLDWVQEQTKGRRVGKVEDMEFEVSKLRNGDGAGGVDGDGDVPMTPTKKRKTITTGSGSVASTPKSSVKSTKFITPTSKRIMVKKPLEITPLGTRILSPLKLIDGIMASPYGLARTSLHVSAVPSSLPCRDNEFSTVYTHLHSAIADGSGTCIYISGTPGTGKTATVREVVASLHLAVQSDELDDFNFVEINGMKVTEPSQSYSLLWEALKGDRVSPANALSLLEHEFSHPSPRRIPCVVLMDELDQLVTKSQSVMYNFFNWPSLRHSRLIVLAVANTMDLPERTLSNKISSRLGLTRITFPGYSHQQLMEIIQSRLEGARGVVDADAVQFAARKVAAVSGDARRALDICRRAVEIAESQAKEADERDDVEQSEATTPSKTGRGKKINGVHDNDATPTAKKTQPRVTIATIKQAINEATSSPIAQHLRSSSLAAKLFLAALLARSRRTGISESSFGDIMVEAKRITDAFEDQAFEDLFLYGLDADMSVKRNKLPRVLALDIAVTELVEAGIVAMDNRSRGERSAKIRLRIGEEEVKASLKGDSDIAGWGFDS